MAEEKKKKRSKKKDVDKGGRPTVMTDEVVQKLEEAFKWDFDAGEACIYAGIAESTYYLHFQKDESFRRKMESAQAWPAMLAEQVVLQSIDKGDVNSAWKFLERRKEKYQVKQVTENTNKNLNLDVTDGLNDEQRRALAAAFGESGGKKGSSEE